MTNIKQSVIEFYLDWEIALRYSKAMTPESMAHHYNMTTAECEQLIDLGRQWYKESRK